LSWQRPFSDGETNIRLNIYSHMSTNPGNLAKIGLVVLRSFLLQAIVKNDDDEDDEKERN